MEGEEFIGTITHYFDRPHVGVIKLDAAIATGDVLHFHGHTTDFQQQLTSMEIEHAKVETADAGSQVAIQVSERVRRHDRVYRVSVAEPETT